MSKNFRCVEGVEKGLSVRREPIVAYRRPTTDVPTQVTWSPPLVSMSYIDSSGRNIEVSERQMDMCKWDNSRNYILIKGFDDRGRKTLWKLKQNMEGER